MKKIITLTVVISLVIFVLFSAGCDLAEEKVTEKTTDKETEEATEEKETVSEDETAEEESTEEDDMAEEEETATYSGGLDDARIAFICASVGENWNINGHFPDLDITVYAEYQFDKGNVIRDILQNNKPDIMIIKECAAYFPPETSMDAYKNLIIDWVNLCRDSGVIPVLTTVVPIDPNNPGNQEGQLESILEFNDWIRSYCINENISLLDLEAALRVSENDRILNPAYDSGDGLHPNDLAYTEKIDYILIPVLEEALGS